jgi:threonylcarbamoyladenosine tRNA methylthiotransferase MtaB
MKTYKKAYIKNFGCKVNQSESESLMRTLRDCLCFVDDVNLAEIVFINSCAVTEKASEKSLKFIKNIKRNFPEKKIIIMGCLAALIDEEINDSRGDLVILNNNKERIREILEKLSYISSNVIDHDEYNKRYRTRAFLKIQDGCDNFCAYCIIPFLRGAPKSKPKDIILEELKSLINDGYKEIVLVGTHLGKYGIETNTKLSDVLTAIEDTEGDFRIRISSIEINELDDSLINIIANSKKICHHLHIPLQSGSNKVLKLMNRNYDKEKFLNIIKSILKKIPEVSIGFDVIVGFPGETESDFNDTLNLIDEIKPHYLHVFPYSDRPYTKACNMSYKVDKTTIKERVKQLKELGGQLKISAYRKKIGKKLRVLIERDCTGYSDDYFKVRVSEGDINSFQYVFANKLDMDSKILIGTNEDYGVSDITEDKKEAHTSNLLE